MTDKLLDYFNGDDLAASVWLNKYALEGEETPDDMHRRMAKRFAEVEFDTRVLKKSAKYKKASPKLSKMGRKIEYLKEDEIYDLFKDFKYIVPQGSIMSQLGGDSIGSLSNCFVLGQPKDSYGGIMKVDEEQVQLMKRRGGVGIDISSLRPAGVATSNAARSSTGAVSFMHRFSNTTREVAQNGRRGALMLSMDINHPDILEFIKIKRDLSQVTGANISVKLNDKFMEAVEKDEDYILRFPTDSHIGIGLQGAYDDEYNVLVHRKPYYTKRIKAKEYWDEIIKSAHSVAEPGLMFWGSMVGYSPDGVYPQFKQITTNPCSEIAMQPYDACRLIAVNLFGFVENAFTDKAPRFNFEKFYEVNYKAMRLSDDLVDLEVEHIENILEKIYSDPEPENIKKTEYSLWTKVLSTALESRRTGLGVTGVGDVLAAMGIKYGSDTSLQLINAISDIKLQSELDCTIDLAILRGTFKGCSPSLEFPVVNGTKVPGNRFYDFLCERYPIQVERMKKYGRRNVSWSTLAPTGTTSLMTQTTSGIEPLFMPFYIRRKKVNPGEDGVRVDFIDQNGDTWQEFSVLHPKFKDWIISQPLRQGFIWDRLTKEQLQKFFEKSPWYGSTANDIDWAKRVEIQATMQKYITHSISSTINLPKDVSEEIVSEIYMESWKKGLKGITVYRDGSRSGVLVSDNDKALFEYHDAIKRPRELYAEAHTTVCNGDPYNVIVGLLNGKPYEVFMDNSDNKYSDQGEIVKKARGKYLYVNGEAPIDILSFMSDEEEAITRLTSASLRHGANIKFVVEQLQKTPGDMFSFTKGLARVLKKYIPNGEESTVECKNPDCTGDRKNVIFEEGCSKCLDCGSSKCG